MTAQPTASTTTPLSSASHGRFGRLRQMLRNSGGFGFVVSLAVANVGNLVFHVIASHRMGPENYGALGTLLAVMLAASLPTVTLQVATTKAAAAAMVGAQGARVSSRRLMVRVGFGALAGAVTVSAVSPVLASYLHLDSTIPVLWMAAFLVPSFLGTIARGVLLVDLRFGAVAGSILTSTAVKVGLAWYLFDSGTSLSTATALVFFVESLLAASLLWRAHRWLTADGLPMRVSWRETCTSAAAFSGLWAMLAVDLILARHFLSANDAGGYIAAATAARAVLFVPQSIAVVAHARMVSASPFEARRILRGALGATVAVSIGSIVVLWGAGPLLIAHVFGGEFTPSASLVGLLATTAGLLAMTNLFVHYRLALGLGVNSVWLGSVLIVAAAALYHGSSTQIAAAAVLGAAIALRLTLPRSSISIGSSSRAPLQDPARVDVSVILAVHEFGSAAIAQIRDVAATMDRTNHSFEIIAVVHGSSDVTLTTLEKLSHRSLRVILQESNHGKGSALRRGVEVAAGSRIAFLDVDGNIAASHIPHYLDILELYGADVVIGSKRHPESAVSYPPVRRLYSWGYQLLVRLLFRISIRDTQVGVKVFTRETLRDAIPYTTERGFVFDLELLSVAHRVGHRRIVEAPVSIGHQFTSAVHCRSAAADAVVDDLDVRPNPECRQNSPALPTGRS